MASNQHYWSSVVRWLYCFHSASLVSAGQILWETFSMDNDLNNCVRAINNDNMAEGDRYHVMSDNHWHGHLPSRDHQPPECWAIFNFVDRIASLEVQEWMCENSTMDIFLDIYSNCIGERKQFMTRMNCSHHLEGKLYLSIPCVSLYHYRGHIGRGYFFVIRVTAETEVLPFPVGGIAGVVVTLIIGILLLTKFVAHLWTAYKKQKKRKRMLEYSGTRKQMYSRRFDADMLTPTSEQRAREAMLVFTTSSPSMESSPIASTTDRGRHICEGQEPSQSCHGPPLSRSATSDNSTNVCATKNAHSSHKSHVSSRDYNVQSKSTHVQTQGCQGLPRGYSEYSTSPHTHQLSQDQHNLMTFSRDMLT